LPQGSPPDPCQVSKKCLKMPAVSASGRQVRGKRRCWWPGWLKVVAEPSSGRFIRLGWTPNSAGSPSDSASDSVGVGHNCSTRNGIEVDRSAP
jgi:hypothetical protein